jgi:hypothetical protein
MDKKNQVDCVRESGGIYYKTFYSSNLCYYAIS